MPTINADLDLAQPIQTQIRTDFVRVRVDRTVGEALADVRSGHVGGRIVYFYVLDDKDRLVGVVPTRRLLLSEATRPIRDLMISNVVTVPLSATVGDACKLFVEHRFLAIPVVDGEGHMSGVLDIELYTNEVGELHRHTEAEDLFQLIGVRLASVDAAGPWRAFRSRFPWLLCNVGGGLACAAVSDVFSGVLAKVVALAFFVPIVLALAESVSIQSLTLALQEHHGKRTRLRDILRGIAIESPLGLMLGLGCAATVGIIVLPWQGSSVAACLVAGITATMALAALIGRSVPIILHLFERDPRVASGPITLATTDVLTLTIYLGLATLAFL
jgi:magnesium transporter